MINHHLGMMVYFFSGWKQIQDQRLLKKPNKYGRTGRFFWPRICYLSIVFKCTAPLCDRGAEWIAIMTAPEAPDHPPQKFDSKHHPYEQNQLDRVGIEGTEEMVWKGFVIKSGPVKIETSWWGSLGSFECSPRYANCRMLLLRVRSKVCSWVCQSVL